MSTRLAWTRLARRLGPFRGDAIAPWRAGRVGLSVAVPLLLGWASGHVHYGAYAALGAVAAGTASFQGETRSRVAAVTVASIGMAASTFIGATTAAIAPWLLVPIVAMWAYFTGLVVCLEQRSSVAVLQWSVALLIGIGSPSGPAEAALRAAFVLAGGLLQALLVAASWSIRPGARERAALAASYHALAMYASDVAAGSSAPPSPAMFRANPMLNDPNPWLSRPLRFGLLNLLEEAERIRASLAALAVPCTQADFDANEARALRVLIANIASALELVACALGNRDERLVVLDELDDCIGRWTIAEGVSWRWSGEALVGQMRSVARMLAGIDAARAQRASDIVANGRIRAAGAGHFGAAVAMLRYNVTMKTEAGQHALRLAVVTALSEMLVQATGLYQGRWVTLTIFLVLKPDYASTLDRGVQRVFGTALGVALAAMAVWVADPGDGSLIAMASVCVAVAYALVDASYLVFGVFISLFVVLLLGLLGTPVVTTVEARLYDTFLGATLALTAYIAWPTWHGATARERFAALIEAHRDYSAALLREAARPNAVGAPALRALQAAAGRTRSDAEAATARLSEEPAHSQFPPEFAQRLIAIVARLAHAELALHALVLSPSRHVNLLDAHAADAAARDLGVALVSTLSRVATALRTGQAAYDIASLRPIYSRLSSASSVDSSPLVTIADRMVDAVDTLDAAVREHPGRADAI